MVSPGTKIPFRSAARVGYDTKQLTIELHRFHRAMLSAPGIRFPRGFLLGAAGCCGKATAFRSGVVI